MISSLLSSGSSEVKAEDVAVAIFFYDMCRLLLDLLRGSSIGSPRSSFHFQSLHYVWIIASRSNNTDTKIQLESFQCILQSLQIISFIPYFAKLLVLPFGFPHIFLTMTLDFIEP